MMAGMSEPKRPRKEREQLELLELLFANVPFFLAYLDLQFNFVRVNASYARAEGRDPQYFVGRNHFDLYPNSENQQIFRDVAKTGVPVFAHDKPFVYSSHPERGVTYWDWSLQPVRVEGGPIRGLLLTLVDRSERVKAQLAEKESDAKFRLITETIEEVFWMSTPGVTQMLYVSPAYQRIWGRSVESLYRSPQSYVEAVHPEDRQRVLAAVREHAEGRYRVEYRIIRPDGSVRWISDRGYPVTDSDGALTAMTGVAMDVTDQRLVAQELLEQQARLRRLAADLTTAEDKERRHLAAELHETVAQELAVARMKLDVLLSQVDESAAPRCRAEMAEVGELVASAIRQTRSLMLALDPLALHHGDLEGALAALLRRIGETHRLQTELIDDGSAKPLDEACRQFLFRAVRETLLNVVKHAEARRATVSLKRGEGTLRIVVEDDGKGFPPGALSGKRTGESGGYGLYSIAERIKAWNGSLEIGRRPGGGSYLVLSVPSGEGCESPDPPR